MNADKQSAVLISTHHHREILLSSLKDSPFSFIDAENIDSAIEKLKVQSKTVLFVDDAHMSTDLLSLILKINLEAPLASVIFFRVTQNAEGILGGPNFFKVHSFGEKIDSIYDQEKVTLKHLLFDMGYTERQIKIIDLISRGECNKKIAEEIHLSVQGVKYHIGILLKSFSALNRRELRKKLLTLTKKS